MQAKDLRENSPQHFNTARRHTVSSRAARDLLLLFAFGFIFLCVLCVSAFNAFIFVVSSYFSAPQKLHYNALFAISSPKTAL